MEAPPTLIRLPNGIEKTAKYRLDDTKDLSPDQFRRLVAHRARQLIDPNIGVVETESERRALERKIDEHFEKVFQTADFLPVSFLMVGAERAKAVCRIRTSTSLGTGFLVARNILMTNHHVLETAAEAGRSVAEFGFEADSATLRVPLNPSRFFINDEDLDFAICALEEGFVEDVAPIVLRRNPALVTRNERVSIIQHPRGRPKEVALHENDVTRVRDKVIWYHTDTEPGSSGSPVFNQAWELVALHHAGWHDNGDVKNEGIRISAIVEHILNPRRRESLNHETFEDLLGVTPDTSPYLGFFDRFGADHEGVEVEVPDHVGTREFIDVGFWNIEHFNNRVAPERVERVAEVVAHLSMDALGLTEVQEGALEQLVTAVGQRGQALDFILGDAPGSQDLAVLFDKETTTAELRDDLIERHRDRLEAKTPAGRSAFPRFPLFVQCSVADDESNTAVDFLMIVVHLKAFGDAESRARRRLASEILVEIIEEVRQRERLPVVLGGDFNERLDNDVLGSLKDSPDLLSLTLDDATGDAISFVGSRHRSLIDHVLVSSDVQLGDISGDDAAIVRFDQSTRDFASAVSDHVPVVIRIVFRDHPLSLRTPTNGEAPEALQIDIPEAADRLRLLFE